MMNNALARRLEKLEVFAGPSGPVRPDVIFLVPLMPDDEESSGEAVCGPYVAFVIGGPSYGIGSQEGETLEEFGQRLQFEYPHLEGSGDDNPSINRVSKPESTERKQDE